jgi:hypothetical protein
MTCVEANCMVYDCDFPDDTCNPLINHKKRVKVQGCKRCCVPVGMSK